MAYQSTILWLKHAMGAVLSFLVSVAQTESNKILFPMSLTTHIPPPLEIINML